MAVEPKCGPPRCRGRFFRHGTQLPDPAPSLHPNRHPIPSDVERVGRGSRLGTRALRDFWEIYLALVRCICAHASSGDCTLWMMDAGKGSKEASNEP